MNRCHYALALSFLVACSAGGQDLKHRPIIKSHDDIQGPLAGESHVEDLQIFEDGEIIYVENVTQGLGGHDSKRSTYKNTVPASEMQRLLDLLNSPEVRGLPNRIAPKVEAIDFFWHKSIEMNRRDGHQTVYVENFYPWGNLTGPLYPDAVVRLECALKDIKAEIPDRLPINDGDWCASLSRQDTATRNQSFAATSCKATDDKSRIVAGFGFGAVRLGVSYKKVEASLGAGRRGSKHKDVYFVDYFAKGVQVSFASQNDTVHAIYFYNHQEDEPEFEPFCGDTEKGLNWQSSIEDAKKLYGQPLAEYSMSGATRLVFDGIDFRFENGRMVRIGVPGR